MNESNDREAQPDGARESAGVLANLPRTRPQRSSARRVAARAASASPAPRASASKPRAAAPRASAKRSKATARKAPAARGSARERESAPRQGFESEVESARGPVAPPGGAELITAAAELVTEVAKAGLSRGADTLRDVLGRLRLG